MAISQDWQPRKALDTPYVPGAAGGYVQKITVAAAGTAYIAVPAGYLPCVFVYPAATASASVEYSGVLESELETVSDDYWIDNGTGAMTEKKAVYTVAGTSGIRLKSATETTVFYIQLIPA